MIAALITIGALFIAYWAVALIRYVWFIYDAKDDVKRNHLRRAASQFEAAKNAHRWLPYIIDQFRQDNKKLAEILNEFSSDMLLKQLDDTLAELEKKKEKDAKAVEAKAKLELLKKEMSS